MTGLRFEVETETHAAEPTCWWNPSVYFGGGGLSVWQQSEGLTTEATEKEPERT